MENSKRYIGIDCSQRHGGERYKSNWRCVQCSRLKKQASKKRNRKYDKVGRPRIERTPEDIEAKKAYQKAYQREYVKSPESKIIREKWLQTPAGKTYAKNKKAKYRASSLSRTPKWLTPIDKWMIKEAYHIATLRTKATGIIWEVDHILPLQGETVSGLHVPANLQVIPKIDNRKKAATYIPT
jgi:hypothetical protein